MKPQPLAPDSGHYEVASDRGGEHWAVIASLIETCKLCDVEPQAYLTDIIGRIVNNHLNSRIDELLPWAYASTRTVQLVA
jgi:transposase